jgi:hypothetical protein
MTTTGISSFNLDINDIIEEAFERCGKELRTGYDFRTARRSLNLLSIEWANRGLNLWTIDQGQIQLNTGQITYPYPTDTVDLLDQVIRTNNGQNMTQIDINISRISESTYSTLPNKSAQGRPIQVWINRQTGGIASIPQTTLSANVSSTATTISVASVADLPSTGFINVDNETILYQNVVNGQLTNCFRGQNGTTAASHLSGANVFVNRLPSINVWPSPNAPGNQYMFVYWRMRRMQDTGTGVSTEDIPFRFLNCLIAGLAYQLSNKLADVDPNRIMMLKADYEQQWQLAADEDREKAPIRFVPRALFY